MKFLQDPEQEIVSTINSVEFHRPTQPPAGKRSAKVSTPCLGPSDELQQLLDDDLPESRQLELTTHIESCAHCQSRLTALAADEPVWIHTRDALCDQPAPPEDCAVALGFLAPSDNPAMLGRIGEFDILEMIGSGGMGIVFKGYDHELNRFVAVKVLHPHCSTSAAARRRFAREAQAAAAVVHQHVVAIHAVGGNHHPPYLVMPFIPGESLQQRLNRVGTLEIVDAVRIAQQVAEGLAAAHAQGLVHRDIKPANILLERNVERVLLTDFGLARAADDASLTQSGVVAGTPQFMSPEQARGDVIDHRTDLFSLGTVMYTLLAGRTPFRAETAMGVLKRVCEDRPHPLRELNPTVPDWLDAIISRLMAKPAADRYETAAKVSELLKGCLAHLQQPTRVPLPHIERPAHHPSRSVIILLGLGICMGLGLGIAFASLRLTTSPGRIAPSPESASSDRELQFTDDDASQEIRQLDLRLRRWESEPESDF